MRNRFSGVARRRLYLYKNPEDNRNFSTRPQLFSYGAGIFRLREAGAERTGRERAGGAHAHRFIRNAEISPLRRLSAGISAFRRNRRPADAPTKKRTPQEVRFRQAKACIANIRNKSLADPMEADLPPLKPGGTRRGAESGLWASCRISIPAGPTTASSG